MKTRIIQSCAFAFLILFVGLGLSGCREEPAAFRFVFMTDIHLQPERNAGEGYAAAVEKVNQLKPRPDFVITGGDLIMDALGQTYERADSLYRLFLEISQHLIPPAYHCIGNHELFGVYTQSGIDPSHPEYGKAMFKNRIGEGSTYRSFDHQGWHFILLDGIGITPERRYIGLIDEEQIEWLKQDLQKTGLDTPVVIALHIPLFSVMTQFLRGPLTPNTAGLVITNAKEVWDVCEDYNVRLVLQGHLHVVEDIGWRNTRFITAGAVSGKWWEGPYRGFEEGFVVVDVRGNDFDWTYETYGWQAER